LPRYDAVNKKHTMGLRIKVGSDVVTLCDQECLRSGYLTTVLECAGLHGQLSLWLRYVTCPRRTTKTELVRFITTNCTAAHSLSDICSNMSVKDSLRLRAANLSHDVQELLNTLLSDPSVVTDDVVHEVAFVRERELIRACALLRCENEAMAEEAILSMSMDFRETVELSAAVWKLQIRYVYDLLTRKILSQAVCIPIDQLRSLCDVEPGFAASTQTEVHRTLESHPTWVRWCEHG